MKLWFLCTLRRDVQNVLGFGVATCAVEVLQAAWALEADFVNGYDILHLLVQIVYFIHISPFR